MTRLFKIDTIFKIYDKIHHVNFGIAKSSLAPEGFEPDPKLLSWSSASRLMDFFCWEEWSGLSCWKARTSHATAGTVSMTMKP